MTGKENYIGRMDLGEFCVGTKVEAEQIEDALNVLYPTARVVRDDNAGTVSYLNEKEAELAHFSWCRIEGFERDGRASIYSGSLRIASTNEDAVTKAFERTDLVELMRSHLLSERSSRPSRDDLGILLD